MSVRVAERVEARLSLQTNTAKVRAAMNPNWVGPLRESAAKKAKLHGEEVFIRTAWTGLPGPEAAYQHEAYSGQVRAAMDKEMPWLADLLRDARAEVIAWVGCFMFRLPEDYQETGYLVDEMTPHTLLVPWACDDEQAAPN